MDKKISIEKCKDGYYYLINARNAGGGVYDSKDRSFIISREKFGATFLFREYHWDNGEPLGTAVPFKEVEKAPDLPWAKAAFLNCVVDDDAKMLAWLAEAEKRHIR